MYRVESGLVPAASGGMKPVWTVHRLSDGVEIARLYDEEAAMLIKAMPELLEAAWEALGEVEEYADIAKPPVKRRVQRVARVLRAAIAKAKEAPDAPTT